MSKRHKIIPWLIGLAVFANTCLYLDYTRLSDDEVAWVKCYNYSSKITFYSTDGQKATMEYLDRQIENSYPLFNKAWAYGSSTYTAFAHYTYNVNVNNKMIDGFFSIRKVEDSLPPYAWYSLGHLYSRYSAPLSTQTFEMNGLEFKDCFVADLSNSEYGDNKGEVSDDDVEKFVISKRYGLIYFKLRNGTEFCRRFKQKTQP